MPEVLTGQLEQFNTQNGSDEARIETPSTAELNEMLAGLTPHERVARAEEVFAGRIVMATTFGPTAPVLLKMVTDIMPDIKTVNVRHGHETKPTQDTTEYYTRHLSLNLHVYEGPLMPIPMDEKELYEFQQKVKVEPFQQMIDDLRPLAFFSGVMRWQTAQRGKMPYAQDRGSVVAINPVLDYTKEDVDNFFTGTGLPKNRDYFDPARGPNQKQECQLNTTDYRLEGELCR